MESASMKAFWAISVGDGISRIGSGLTTFALSVWVLQRTQTLTQFGFLILIASLPGILLMPVAGIAVDRLDRRWTMLVSYMVAGFSALSIAVVLLTTNSLPFGYLVIVVALISTSIAVGTLAATVSVPLLVPEDFLGRANGIMQLGQASSVVLAPMLAGFLVAIVRIQGVVLIDVVTYCVAIICLSVIRIPAPGAAKLSKPARSTLKDALAGWAYLRKTPGMVGVLLYLATITFFLDMSGVLVQSLTLKFGSAAALGIVISAFGLGSISGAIAMSSWGGPKRRMKGILGFGILQGIGLMTAGAKQSILFIALGLFLAAVSSQIIIACARVLWQTRIPSELQGRAFAVMMLALQIVAPLAYLVVGPLADKLFEPLLAERGLLSDSVGHLIGAGSGRGMAFMLIICGVFTLLVSTAMCLNRRIRLLEDSTLTEAAMKEPATSCAPFQEGIQSENF